MRFRPPVEDTPVTARGASQIGVAPRARIHSNIQPNPEPVTPKTKGPNMENEMNSSELKASADRPGELALPHLWPAPATCNPSTPRRPRRAYVTTVAWVSDITARTRFSHRRAWRRKSSRGGAKIKCRACDRQCSCRPGRISPRRCSLARAVCNRYSADPDQACAGV